MTEQSANVAKACAIFAINAGSSSIKFAVYDPVSSAADGEYKFESPQEIARGQVSNIGTAARLEFDAFGTKREEVLGSTDYQGAMRAVLDSASDLLGSRRVIGVGHRIVHGGNEFAAPRLLDQETMSRLRELEPLAPLHQGYNLSAVEASREVFPDAVQVGCFDTAFHRTQPWVSDTFALPRSYYDQGVRRYGFHGLSYEYVCGELLRSGSPVARGRLVIAHLGNGASMCAIKNGKSISSTMGFSALDGLPMGTRCGQLDPGVLLYLLDHEGMSSAEISDLLYRESGLKGLSGITNDMRQLEASDAPEAREAIDYFVFRICRELGALCAVLGGIDALVFTGGIGENSRLVRARVCESMDWLGISLDPELNAANAERISNGAVEVLVVPTDEEFVIARAVMSEVARLH